MARPLRIQYPDAWYHVLNRGRRREEIFLGRADFEMFMYNLEYAAALFNVRVSAWCLMSNHDHLLVNTPEANLSRFMRHIDGVYTQRFTRSHRVDGQLFRGRYQAEIIDPGSDRYMMAVVAYILLNPQKAGLEKELGLYPGSSWEVSTRNPKKWDWVYTKPILDRFSGSLTQQRIAFQKYVQSNHRIFFMRSSSTMKERLPWVISHLFSGSSRHSPRTSSITRSPNHDHLLRESKTFSQQLSRCTASTSHLCLPAAGESSTNPAMWPCICSGCCALILCEQSERSSV
jgi:REP element-mobilizing transposase RayT